MDKQVIYYGLAPNVPANIEKYISIAGKPICFTTMDVRFLSKYKNKVYLDKYNVLSTDDVISKYPDADIWITFKDAGGIANNLLNKGIAPEKIHFFEADLEYRKGCKDLGSFMVYSNKSIACCCSNAVTHNSHTKVKGDIAERIAYWKEYSEKMISDVNNNVECACSKCYKLVYGFFPKKVQLKTITFSSNLPGDVCNYRCIFCSAPKHPGQVKQEEGLHNLYEVLCGFSKIPEYNDSNITFWIANGEICVNKYRNEIFDILINSKWHASFYTNASLYNEKFNDFLKTGRTEFVTVSLDAGTNETYKKVKRGGISLDKVVSNLKKYSFDKTRLNLKYVFIENINDNQEDVDNFYKIVKEINCKNIHITTDLCKPMTQNMRKLVERLIRKSKRDGIYLAAPGNYVDPNDLKFILKTYNETAVSEYDSDVIVNTNAIIHNPYKTGAITGNGTVELNVDAIVDDVPGTQLILGNNSNLIVAESLLVSPSVKIELAQNSTLSVNSAKIASGAIIKCKEHIEIGNNVSIAENCYISDIDLTNKEVKKDKNDTQKASSIKIGNNVQICYSAVISNRVTIGDNAVIAPYAVVLNDVDANTVVAGNPAQKIEIS